MTARLRWMAAGAAFGDHRAVLHHRDRVRERHHHAHVVLDDEQRDALRFGERARRGDRAVGLRLAHARGRLVHQQQRRSRGERAREVHALQHAERQLGRRRSRDTAGDRSARERRAPRASPRSRVGAHAASTAPRARSPPCAWRPTPISTLSSTDSSPNGSTCWNVRPMPRRDRTCAGRSGHRRRRAARVPARSARRP